MKTFGFILALIMLFITAYMVNTGISVVVDSPAYPIHPVTGLLCFIVGLIVSFMTYQEFTEYFENRSKAINMNQQFTVQAEVHYFNERISSLEGKLTEIAVKLDIVEHSTKSLSEVIPSMIEKLEMTDDYY